MPSEVVVRIRQGKSAVDLAGSVEATGGEAAARFEALRARPGARVLVAGDPAFCVALAPLPTPAAGALLTGKRGGLVEIVFTGRPPLRRKVVDVVVVAAAAPGPVAPSAALDLTAGRADAPPLFLLADGTFSTRATGPAPRGTDALGALVTAARWISTRRTTTFERLFPPDPFHPERPARLERLSVEQARALLAQLDSALTAAAAAGPAALKDAPVAAQLRSAALTVLSHLVATAAADPAFRAIADEATRRIFALVEAEKGPAASAPLRAHAIFLLQLRGPALSAADRAHAVQLLATLVRAAPPYDDGLKGPWRFAMCNGYEFHTGECDVLRKAHGFRDVPATTDAAQVPAAPGGHSYTVLEAPFKNPSGDTVRVYARTADPSDENTEMGSAFFHGLLVNRHAQLGSFDLRATALQTKQQGYKLMMNSQCAGLTTRFAITRVFPDADVYSSWDSTFFRTEGGDESGPVIASEGLDCFVAILEGMSKRESHAQLEARIQRAQWHHDQSSIPGFVQFVGPAHPLVVRRFEDVNQDGKADVYDGFLDLTLKAIAEDVRASSTPRDPGVPSSQIGGEAARGLGLAVGSLDRVAQYSELWAGLPGDAERLYAFAAGGFYSQREPPADVPVAAAPVEELGRLPAVCRYRTAGARELAAEVMLHAWLSHAGKEYKRLLVAAEAMWRAFDLGHLPKKGALASLASQRGAVLLCLAGLLEFPADQNQLDALWSAALAALRLPDISRSVVRNCITSADHDASNYYGSARGLDQLLGPVGPPSAGHGDTGDHGDLGRADPAAWARLHSADPTIGRAAPLALAAAPRVS